MKKKTLALLLCLCVALAAVPTACAENDTFTLMVYLCGTDLESEGGMGTADLGEMVYAGIPADSGVTVYVQTGGTKQWQVDGISNGKGERWLVCEEGMLKADSLGKVNMGDASTFADFLTFGFENFPADRYGLILWDHGSGATGGVCYDELTGDALMMPEIYEGLKAGCAGREPFTFIGFDACLMATYEVACHVAPFAKYLVASEELEPGTGWSYDGWLPALANNPGISMEELGPIMVNSFLRATREADSTDYATLSVTNLEKIGELQSAVEGMGAALGNAIDSGEWNAISRLRQNVRSFGEISDSASDMVDMTTFAEVYARYDQQAAARLKAALEDAVVYSGHTNNLSGVTGLSILVPFATRQYADSYLASYEQMNLSPDYIRFVEKMLGNAGAGSYDFGTPSVSTQSIESAQIDWFSQYASDPDAYQSDASSLWGQLYGPDMTEENATDFSLDDFLNTLFASGDNGFNTDYDDSQASLWGDQSQYSDESSFTDGGFGSSFWGQQATQGSSVIVGDNTLANPFANSSGDYAYTVELTPEQLQNLGKAEANLMMDMSDPDFECYVELGYVQDVVTDWNRGKIYGMFNGTWATLDGQMVCLYDQIANERYIRSVIPVKLNGEECYLLAVFDEEHPSGIVKAATVGYTDEGLPARGSTPLAPGDKVIPLYELIYWDEEGQQQSEPFEGIEIVVGADGTIPFGYEAVESDASYLYGFCLTDVYGDYQFTDFLTLEF